MERETVLDIISNATWLAEQLTKENRGHHAVLIYELLSLQTKTMLDAECALERYREAVGRFLGTDTQYLIESYVKGVFKA